MVVALLHDADVYHHPRRPWVFDVVADGPWRMAQMRRVHVPFTLLSRPLHYAACVTRCEHWGYGRQTLVAMFFVVVDQL